MAREGLMDDCGYEPYVDEDAWNDGFKAGFLMAVDEFAEKLLERKTILFDNGHEYINAKYVRKIAEQLKEET